MKIQVFRNGQLFGNFEEEKIHEAVAAGLLKHSDEYHFAGMSERRPMSDFVISGNQSAQETQDAKGFIRVHRNPARSRQESRRNDFILMAVLIAALFIGFSIMVYKDVNAKREKQRQAEFQRMWGGNSTPRVFPPGSIFSSTAKKPEPSTEKEDQVPSRVRQDELSKILHRNKLESGQSSTQ